MDGTLFLKALQMSLTASYVFCVVWIAGLFLRKIARKYCYYLWLVVFLNLCIPVSIYSSFSLVPGMIRQQAETITKDLKETEEASGEVQNPEKVVLIQNTLRREYDQSVFGDLQGQSTDSDDADIETNTGISFRKYLPLAEKIWIVGILGLGMYSIAVSVKFQRRLNRSKKEFWDKEAGIVEVKRLSSPFVWGFFSPKIYLPAGMEDEEREYVLRHEKYHRKRKDHLVKILLYGITVIYWYHPLVWLSYHLCCKDMEISCDEAVLERADKNIRKAYAQSLLKFAAKQNHYVFTPLTFGEPSVRSRIENVLKYRKKGIALSAVAVVVTLLLGIGLMTQPKETDSKEQATIEPADFLKLKVYNNGGEVIKVGSNLYYDSYGEGLYSDGRYLYGTQSYEDGSPSMIYRYELDGSGYKRLAEGRITGMSEDRKILYYISGEETKEAGNGFFAGAMDLATGETRILSVFHGFSMEEITCAYGDEQGVFFAAGSYEGSAGYYYGNFYYADFAEEELGEMHLTDADVFWATDQKIYYQKYDNFGEAGNDLYCTDFAMSEERKIAENVQLLAIDPEKQRLFAEKNERIFTYSMDGQEEREVFSPKEALAWECMENDHVTFRETNVIGDDIYVKVQHWRYEEDNGWRDSLIEETYLKISADGGEYQEWNPASLLAEAELNDWLNAPVPGKPVTDLSKWNLEDITDVRETFQEMSYVPKEGEETKTYLLGKTEHYTLYGKGDQEQMLLESEGTYAQIRYTYTSNYMTPLELMEADLDDDGQMELGIKLNIKHGTGVSVDTFLLADRESDGELYVYQFLEEDCQTQFLEHLSYEVTEDGIWAKVDGKDAGPFLENEEGMDPYIHVTCGSQLHFTYENGQILAGAELQFLQDEIGAFYGINGQEICGVVNWTLEEGFVITEITDRAAANGTF